MLRPHRNDGNDSQWWWYHRRAGVISHTGTVHNESHLLISPSPVHSLCFSECSLVAVSCMYIPGITVSSSPSSLCPLLSVLVSLLPLSSLGPRLQLCLARSNPRFSSFLHFVFLRYTEYSSLQFHFHIQQEDIPSTVIIMY